MLLEPPVFFRACCCPQGRPNARLKTSRKGSGRESRPPPTLLCSRQTPISLPQQGHTSPLLTLLLTQMESAGHRGRESRVSPLLHRQVSCIEHPS